MIQLNSCKEEMLEEMFWMSEYCEIMSTFFTTLPIRQFHSHCASMVDEQKDSWWNEPRNDLAADPKRLQTQKKMPYGCDCRKAECFFNYLADIFLTETLHFCEQLWRRLMIDLKTIVYRWKNLFLNISRVSSGRWRIFEIATNISRKNR